MIKNKIQFERLGSIGAKDISMLTAKGLRRIIIVNNADLEDVVELPDELIEVSDMSTTDYKIAKEIFNRIWDDSNPDSPGVINIQSLKCAPTALEIEVFKKKFKLEDVISKDNSTCCIEFIERFNLIETHFLGEEGE